MDCNCFDDVLQIKTDSIILERETIIAKLAAKAREKSMAEGSLNYNINKPYSSSYEAGYRDALSRLWDVIQVLKDVEWSGEAGHWEEQGCPVCRMSGPYLGQPRGPGFGEHTDNCALSKMLGTFK